MTDPNYPQVPPTIPPAAPYATPWATPGTPPVPEVPLPPAGDERPRTRARIAAIAVAVVAVGAGGAFALQSFGNDEGGAATPEEAATRLVDAIAKEDVLGVIELLPDGERDVLRDLTTSAQDEYQRLGLLSDAFRLDGFPGVDITAEDVEFDVEEITDGLVQVTITDGDFHVATNGDELVGNLGDVIEAVADARDEDLEVDDTDEDIDASEFLPSFTVIEQDGRWYPSIAFTIAELGRTSSFDDLDAPDLDAGVEPHGADSPEAAIQALIDAGVSLDAEDAIAILDPGEADALQVYSQFFLPLDADAPEDLEISAELTDADVESLGGGVNRVVPTGFELHLEQDGGTADVVLDDGCVDVDVEPPDGEGEPFEQHACLDDEAPDQIGDVEISDELRDAIDAFLPLRFGIITVERDGEHFVAPIRTIGDLLLGVTSGLEREDLEEGGAVFALLSGELDDEINDLFEQLADSAFGFEDEEVFDSDIFEDDGFDEDCEGVGCGFGEDEGTENPTRVPTGASGPNGELLPFDAVATSVPEGSSVTLTAVADIDGDYLVGAQGAQGYDSTIRVVDTATGEELGSNDDFFDFDPEVLVTLQAGQTITIEVAGFDGSAGDVVVYFEPF